MSASVRIRIDGVPVEAQAGSTILAAATAAGIEVPHLCHDPSLPPAGSCRLCTCKVNGRYAAACTTPVAPGQVVENDAADVRERRRVLVELLFAEGNHFCPSCERSGNCELQHAAYRLGIEGLRVPAQWPRRTLDGSHSAVFIDRNTCILCGLCVRASRERDGTGVFGFEGRGSALAIAVDAPGGLLAGSAVDAADRAVALCPVACLLVKGTAYRTPYGARRYDHDE